MELLTPGSAVRFTSVARPVPDCATRPGALASNTFTCQPTKFHENTQAQK